MSVETLGEAFRLGWKVTARCSQGKRDGMRSIPECINRYELDMATLLWTRGPNFPLSRLAERMMCTRCGSRQVPILFDAPRHSDSIRIAVLRGQYARARPDVN